MKSTFLKVCLGIAMVALSVGFLIRSIGTLNAAPDAPAYFPEEGSKIGKYTFHFSPYTATERAQLLLWDTELGTGKWFELNRGVWSEIIALPKLDQ
jgi:hypothetical protein